MRLNIFLPVFLSILLLTRAGQVQAQTGKSELYSQVARLDSTLFAAFNSRDVATFSKYFDKSLEFYHDKGGLTNYEHTVGFLTSTATKPTDLKRELVKEELEVYPIPGYGAMQIGTHRFCHTENGKQVCGTFKFVHIWQQQNDQWKITRVVSYGH